VPADIVERRRQADAREIDRMVARIALEIAGKNPGLVDVAFVGIHTRGVPLARRILAALPPGAGSRPPPLGTLDIAFYRDDFDRPDLDPTVEETRLDFDVTGARIVLVDDVLATGRTVRAAIDAVIDFGRPREVQLAVLVDRGGRELPVAPTYVGVRVDVGPDEAVLVRLPECDPGEEGIFVVARPAPVPAGGARGSR
jgi:pyrimidine operon attenuation protein/uracil phosphoribosyltransferase